MIHVPLIIAAFGLLWWALLRIFRGRSPRILINVSGALLSIPACLLLALWIWNLTMRVRVLRVAAHIEEYRAAHGNYPASLSKIPAIPTNGSIHYELALDRPDACLWFGTGFGGVSQYDLAEHKWY